MMYRMVLQALGNPDHGENPYQYIAEPKEITGRTIDELVKQANDWIDENDIGSGNWSMTEVWLTDGNGYGGSHAEFVGFMSYNGRIWADDPNKVYTYFITTTNEDEFDWCLAQTKDEEEAKKIFDSLTPIPGWIMELRKTYEDVDTYRTYEVMGVKR